MAIKGAIFDNQKPTAKQLGGVFKPMFCDGILQGCNITYSGSNAFIAAGEMMGCGRAFELTAQESIALSGSGYARIICNINLNNASTSSSFAQVSFTTETKSSEASFATLTQDNINMGGTLYQFEVARFQVSSGTITQIVSTCGNVGIKASLCKFLPDTYYGSTLPATGEEGQIFFKIV